MLRVLRTLFPTVVLAAALGVAAAAPAGAAPAGPTPAADLLPTADIQATIGACYLSGHTRPNTTFRLTHKAASGKLKVRSTITSDGFGDWERGCPTPSIARKDRLELRLVGDSTIFKALTIPALTLTPDRVHDKVRGTAKGVASVGLGLAFCDPGHTVCNKSGSAVVPVDPATHAFSWTLPEDATGLSTVLMEWKKGDDTVILDQDFAHVVVRLGSAGVIVVGPRGGTVESVSLKRGSIVSRISRRTNAGATFTGTFKRDGGPLKVRKGDRVTSSVAGDVSLAIPDLAVGLMVDGAAGTCFKNRPYSVSLIRADGIFHADSAGTTDASGRWEFLAVISAGWSINAWCANAAGDIVGLRTVVN